jgi:hypothetical protein
MTGSSEHVNIKSCILWDISLCSTLKVNRRFGGAYCLNIHDRRIGESINQRETGSKQGIALIFCLAYSSMLKIEEQCTSETSVDCQ